MGKALTVKFLENLKPGPTRREIPDGVVTGLYLILQVSGKMSWAVRYRVAGRPRKLTIGGYPAIGLKARP
jgi:Arm DNA-binding domain